MDNITKIRKNVIELFVPKQQKQIRVVNKQQAHILDVNILADIVKELSIIRQIKEGSLKYDQKNDQYLNQENKKTKPENILKPTFVQFQPTVTEKINQVETTIVKNAPAGIGILGLVFLLSSPNIRGFIWGALKEVLIGKDGLLPEPFKDFINIFITNDEKKNPINVIEKANEENEKISVDVEEKNSELENNESEIESIIATLMPKIKNAKKASDDVEKSTSQVPETETKPTPAATPTPKPVPVATQAPTTTPKVGFEGGGQAKEGYVGAATANMRTGRRAKKEPTPETKPTPAPAPAPAPKPTPEKIEAEQKPAPTLTKPPTSPGFEQGKRMMIEAMNQEGITDPMQRAQIVAQTAHESGKFRYTQELGNESYFQRYEGRKDLGNVNPGDGLRYIGRGFLQTTGRINYEQFQKEFNVNVIDNPAKLAEPQYAAKSALFWFKKNARKVAKLSNNDWTNTKAITLAVNGGYNGLEERIHYFNMFKDDSSITKIEPKQEQLKNQTGTQVAAASATVVGEKKEQEAKKKVVTNIAVLTTNQTTAMPN